MPILTSNYYFLYYAYVDYLLGDLKSIVQEYKAKCDELESIKWDLEYATLRKEYDVGLCVHPI